MEPPTPPTPPKELLPMLMDYFKDILIFWVTWLQIDPYSAMVGLGIYGIAVLVFKELIIRFLPVPSKLALLLAIIILTPAVPYIYSHAPEIASRIHTIPLH